MKGSRQNIHRQDVVPIFFHITVNSQVYVTELLQPFFAQLTEEEHVYAFFQ